MSQFNIENYFYAKKVLLLRGIPVVVLRILYQWMQNIIMVNLFYRK